MTPSHLFRLTLALVVLGLTGCPRTIDSTSDCAGRVAGDLIITEFMNDPAGTDEGKEWFEIYNNTKDPIQLRGLSLVFSKVDGTSAKSHVMLEGSIPAGGYFVVGDADNASKPEYIDYSYGTALGGLSNGEGRITLKCGETVVDKVEFADVGTQGHSRELDGKIKPDAIGNDNAANWCNATADMGASMFGTPGEENDACATSGNCVGGDGKSRTVVAPKAGELIITEFMANPAAIADEAGEWIEVYAQADVDLNGLVVSSGSSKSTLASNDCLSVTAGSYVVIARTADATKNGGLFEPRAVMTTTLANSKSDIALKSGETLIDQIWFDATKEGFSSQLDPSQQDPTSNDNALTFCYSEIEYGTTGQKGSPGAPNVACPNAPNISKCLDASSGTEVERDTLKAASGSVVITELMPAPLGTPVQQSWFEIFVRNDMDLNGLEFSNGTDKMVFAPRSCVRVPGGSFVVFARNASTYTNGGLPAEHVKGTFNFALPTTGGSFTVSQDLAVLDEMSYLKPTSGVSIQLDPGKVDVTSNDDPVAYCPGTVEYGNAKNKGSPGTANATCPPVVDSSKCKDENTLVERATVPPAVGGLIITEIMASPNGTDTDKEWFEVLVTADADLNGLVIANEKGAKTTIASETCKPVKKDQYLIFARSTDPTLNGGLPAVDGVFAFSLNSNGSIVLKHGTNDVDFALYVADPSGAEGTSAQLDSRKVDPTQNDKPENFCPGTIPYGTSGANFGTPGAGNLECPPPVDPNFCLDTGVSRPVVKPGAGDLVITEVMADPSKVSDDYGEWLEIYFAKDVDLNGVQLSFVSGTTTKTTTLLAPDCIRPGTGSYVVLARAKESSINGGLPSVTATFPTALTATGTMQLALKRDGVIVDLLTYPKPGAGYSQQLSSDKLNATDNDTATNWCAASSTATYGLGDHGTPGAANASCGAVVNPNECIDPATKVARAVVAPAVGDLVISEYLSDPSKVGDTEGEWIEVFVKSDVDLNGVELSVNTTKSALVAGNECVRPGAGKYLVLAHSSDAATNGGLPLPQALFPTGLTNGGGQTLSLSRSTVVIDTVTTASSSAGVSKQLSGNKLDATENDTATNWCNTTAAKVYGAGDRGTPGADNETCQ